MTSVALNINDANQMVQHRSSAVDGRVKLLDAANDWAWVTLISEPSDQPPTLHSLPGFQELHQFENADGRSKSWFFVAEDGPVYLDGLAESVRAECFVGSLPKPLMQLLEEGDGDDGVRLSQLLAMLCTESQLAAIPDELARNPNSFELLRGAAAIARRLGMFQSEVTLLKAALNIRRSTNVTRLLSYAQSNAQDYPGAIESAHAAIAADPNLKDGPFKNHLDELSAYVALGSEIRGLAETRSPRSIGSGKVAYCLHSARPFGHGGYAMRSHGLYAAIHARGREIIAMARPGFPSDGHTPSQTPNGKFAVDGLPYLFANEFGRRGRAYGYIRDAADYFETMFSEHQIEIVHAATNFWTALPAAIAAFRLNLPFVYEIRSFWTVTREARVKNFAKSPQAVRDEALENITLAMADQIITLNAQMRDKLIAMGADPDSTAIVPNCVNPDIYVQPDDRDLRYQLGLLNDDVVIGYMGAMLDYEGIDLLVEAVAPIASTHPNVKILLVGADPEARDDPASVEHRLTHQIARHSLHANVQLLDRVSPEEARGYYQLFDICVYPRRGLEVCELVSPLKPLEAMAAGKTVIGSDVAGLSAMLRDKDTGLIFPREDIDALRETLRLAIENPQLRDELGSRALKFVNDERRWETAADLVDGAYQRAGQPDSFQPGQLIGHVDMHFANPPRHL